MIHLKFNHCSEVSVMCRRGNSVVNLRRARSEYDYSSEDETEDKSEGVPEPTPDPPKSASQAIPTQVDFM